MSQIPARLSFSWIDHIGVPGSTELFATVDSTGTVATMITDFQGFIDDIVALSDDGLVQASIALLADVSGLGTPAADSESEQGLLLNFSQTGSRYKFGVWVPGLKDTLVVDGKIVVSGGAVAAFDSLMSAGSGIITSVSKYLLPIAGMVDAAQSFRKLRRRSAKVTKTAGS
jgi:hypothetical protein